MVRHSTGSTTGPVIEVLGRRMIAWIRLILALSALIIIRLDPSEPDRYVLVTYLALILYTLYSLFLYAFSRQIESGSNTILSREHWADVCWYLLLIALSSGTNSLFFHFFFFSILVASFRWGFVSGFRVTIASAILFTVIGYLTVPSGADLEWNRLLLRPLYLIVLGYMMASLGEYQIRLLRQLALLKEINVLSNPRFGVDRTIGTILERLRAFYQADHCLLIMSDLDTGEYVLRRAVVRDPESGSRAVPLAESLKNQLLSVHEKYAVIYNEPSLRSGDSCYVYDVTKNEHVAGKGDMCEPLTPLFDVKSFISVPVHFRHQALGRMYITSSRARSFKTSDMDFLLQAIKQIMPLIDNIRLVDRLASDAAEEERKRIARDIHDSVIQPYIGLQIGLTTIGLKLNAENVEASKDVNHLLELTSTAISDLRGYVRGLKEADENESNLTASIRRYVEKFSRATGIGVRVEAQPGIRLNDRLAAEIFQMITEGLSNIRRHTHSAQAAIHIACDGDRLILRIENENLKGHAPPPFTPSSIKDRTTSLGGDVQVEPLEDGATAVVVEIPL